MASDLPAQILAASGVWADPWFWTSAAALFAGLAAGQAARAFQPSGSGGLRAARLKPGRISRAIAFLSLGILAAAGFLVLADRSAGGVGGAGGSASFVIWALLIAALAFLAGLHWLAAGLPIGLLFLSTLLLFRLGLQGWAVMDRETGPGFRIASFLPYQLGPASARGQLELFGEAPAARELSLESSSLALSVESLAFAGPLGFIARLAAAPAPLAEQPSGRFYRVAGVAAPGRVTMALPPPPYLPLLDAILPLPAGTALEPGASPATRSAPFGLLRRSLQTSRAAPLVALQPVSFSLSPEGLPSIISP